MIGGRLPSATAAWRRRSCPALRCLRARLGSCLRRNNGHKGQFDTGPISALTDRAPKRRGASRPVSHNPTPHIIPAKAGTYPLAPLSCAICPLRPPAHAPYDEAMTTHKRSSATRRRHAAAMSQIVSKRLICLIPAACCRNFAAQSRAALGPCRSETPCYETNGAKNIRASTPPRPQCRLPPPCDDLP